MSDYVIVAEFHIKYGCASAFFDHMRVHAAASRAEPGCRLFEVALDTTDATRVLLYERYADAAAYQAHRATAHYNRFLDWAPPLLEPKDGALFQRRSVMTAACE